MESHPSKKRSLKRKHVVVSDTETNAEDDVLEEREFM